MKKFTLFVLSFALFCRAEAAGTLPFHKAFIVIFENTDFEATMKQPFFAELAGKGTVFSKFYAVARPSQPNYIALVAGDTFGIHDDNNHDLDKTNIVDLLEAKGISWKVYAEGYPGGCNTSATYGRYVRKHQPLISFKNIQRDPERCANIVNADQFAEDFRKGTVPDYALYIPDMDNDGHDTSVAFSDKWFKKAFGHVVSDKDFLHDRLFVATFDEGNVFNPANHIYTVFLGAGVKPASRVSRRYDLYSLLHTVEEGLGLGTLNRKDKSAPVISEAWIP